ncbi:putative ancient ubiquitous protein 1 [Monocercomonoides exilis]|uniref:putative ancient ubiquitous protein 1 n=1 Tax=Monocercomonoides exilis TaxID=2049356 RepID=UPI00355A6CB4|nr:putative ancient ubiquitous protein 1 [Monocercomonoides exilis]|eukprot:MONOS_12987.1-p1 / transcript=MONOS_12987.1 / gene=MONOS_12987 / organism=Monocercomonoides_exilis_PA203 / gene_product=unspecified product / transcript_product=unspecified product / location=Mono_scaffold00763:11985-13349(+) / protein_length=342 / sequence_SO=supercontig / SO=protein_coding / is_pseudo=false
MYKLHEGDQMSSESSSASEIPVVQRQLSYSLSDKNKNIPAKSEETSDDMDFNHPGEPPLKSMFNKERIQKPWTLKTHLFFILWFPFGLVLGTFKFLTVMFVGMPLMVIFNLFDKEWLFWQTVGRFYNFWSYVRNPEMLAPASEAPIITCNHVTDLDGIAYFPILLTKHAVEITTVFLKPLVDTAARCKWPLKVIIRETDPEKKHLTRERLLEFFNSEESKDRQLFVLAEGATTNGKVGLLQFNRFVFSLDKPIQPLVVRVNPHMPINIDIPSKNMFPNWFWYMFCPFVTYEYTALPVQTRKPNETPEEFARRIQQMTADELGLACTTYSYKHKNRLKKVVR